MTAYNVHVQIGRRYAGRVRPAALGAAARACLRHQAVAPPADLTIVVAGDALLRQLNRDFLGLDAPTDVLSFPTEMMRSYLGDIAISLPRARAQAAAAGHSVEAELQLLVVHGVLHLLGHDHARRGATAAMWAAQEEVLKGLWCRP